MNITELLQNLQDTYAEKLQMSMIITDDVGRAVTLLSHSTSIVKYILAFIRQSNQACVTTQIEWLTQIERAILVDTKQLSPCLGAKWIVAPIRMGDGTTYFLWAGMVIEQGYKPFVIQGLQQHGESGWEEATYHLRELSIREIGEKLNTVDKLVLIVEKLISSQQKKKLLPLITEVMKHSLDGNQTTQDRYQPFINMFMEIEKGIDFVFFAKRQGATHFKIVCANGSSKKQLVSLSLPIEKTCLKEVMEEKQYQTWHYTDRMTHFPIHEFPVQLKSLFCFPIIIQEQVVCIVCGGSETKVAWSADLALYGEILISQMTACLETDLVKESLNRHLMKMASLLDMSKVMKMAKTKDELLHILVDFMLQLIVGNFCIVTLKDGVSVQKTKDMDIQSKELSELHIQDAKRGFLSSCVSEKAPKLAETKWGTILSYPVHDHEEVLGVITIHLQNPLTIKEAEVYMANLVSRGTDALKRLNVKAERTNKGMLSVELGKSLMLETLTSRELEVLQLLVKGCNNRDIGEALYISVHTVKNHITKIFQKLHVSDRSQLIAMIYQLNSMKLT